MTQRVGDRLRLYFREARILHLLRRLLDVCAFRAAIAAQFAADLGWRPFPGLASLCRGQNWRGGAHLAPCPPIRFASWAAGRSRSQPWRKCSVFYRIPVVRAPARPAGVPPRWPLLTARQLRAWFYNRCALSVIECIYIAFIIRLLHVHCSVILNNKYI